MEELQLNIGDIIDSMSTEIANLIKQVYIKNAEIRALRLRLSELESREEVSE